MGFPMSLTRLSLGSLLTRDYPTLLIPPCVHTLALTHQRFNQGEEFYASIPPTITSLSFPKGVHNHQLISYALQEHRGLLAMQISVSQIDDPIDFIQCSIPPSVRILQLHLRCGLTREALASLPPKLDKLIVTSDWKVTTGRESEEYDDADPSQWVEHLPKTVQSLIVDGYPVPFVK